MYEKILAAIDASEIGERVLAAAEELATLGDGEVHVLHLWESEPSRSMACTAPTWEDAQMVVKAATEQLAEAGIKASGEVAANLHSRWAFEITRCANSHDASVIVIGSRRRSDLSSLLAGSTAHKVVHAADCPVVVVP